MKTTAQFIRDFHHSHAVVAVVAAHLRTQGWDAWITPPELRPSPEVRHAYTDTGDIGVLTDCRWKRVEVKSRGFSWTGPSDFPYPSIIVDEAYHVDRPEADHELMAYCIVGSDLSHAAWISIHTRSDWKTKAMWDPAQGRRCDFYMCPTDAVEWITLNE